MKKILLCVSFFLAIFLDQKLNCMSPDLDLRNYTPPQELSYLGGKFVFKLMSPEDMLCEHKFYSTTYFGPASLCPIADYRLEQFVPAANSARFVYSLEINSPNTTIQRELDQLLSQFILVVKISIDTEKKVFNINSENCCFMYEFIEKICPLTGTTSICTHPNFAHTFTPNFLGVSLNNYDKSTYKSDPLQLVSVFFAKWLAIFITMYELLDARKFTHGYNQNIYQTFTSTHPGELIRTLIPECLHCLYLDKLALEFDRNPDNSIYKKMDSLLDHYSKNGHFCPICKKVSFDAICLNTDSTKFGKPFTQLITQQEIHCPRALEMLMTVN